MAFANDDFENARRVKYYWEIIADNRSKSGWSLGCVSATDSNGRTIWIVDAHRDDGKRFVAHADGKLTAFGTGIGDSWYQRLSDAPKAALAFTGNFPVRPSLRPCYTW